MCDLADLLETLEIINKPLKGSCVYVSVYTTFGVGSLHPSLQPPTITKQGVSKIKQLRDRNSIKRQEWWHSLQS